MTDADRELLIRFTCACLTGVTVGETQHGENGDDPRERATLAVAVGHAAFLEFKDREALEAAPPSHYREDHL